MATPRGHSSIKQRKIVTTCGLLVFALLLFMVEKSCWAGEVLKMSQELKETFGSRRDSCRVMSARKRRLIDGDSRSHGAPAVRERETCCWSIHPHGSGMMATMHT